MLAKRRGEPPTAQRFVYIMNALLMKKSSRNVLFVVFVSCCFLRSHSGVWTVDEENRKRNSSLLLSHLFPSFSLLRHSRTTSPIHSTINSCN